MTILSEPAGPLPTVRRATLHNEFERIFANFPLADVSVTVDSRSERLDRIVEMNHFEILEADHFVELF